MSEARCSGCGRVIMWTVTEKGKRSPVDPTPEKRVVIKPNPDDVTTPLSRVVSTFVSHWATCPEAERFRKAKAAERAAKGEVPEPADAEEP